MGPTLRLDPESLEGLGGLRSDHGRPWKCLEGHLSHGPTGLIGDRYPHLSIRSTYLSICVSSIHLFIYLSVYLSLHLPICVSICLSRNLGSSGPLVVDPDFLLRGSFQRSVYRFGRSCLRGWWASHVSYESFRWA